MQASKAERIEQVDELNQELLRLSKLLPSTDAGIEACDLISRAIANVTNENFKRQTIAWVLKHFPEYVTKVLIVLLIVSCGASAGAQEIERGDLKTASMEASLDQTHAETLLKLELNKQTEATQSVAQDEE
jgi:hypothetical protein